MAITEKTRKLLWGRAGNRCAMFRCKLAIDATETDPDSIVGDECHIVSGQQFGPRYDSNFPADKLDEAENLILLCKVHHKLVDDQTETYTADVLRTLKANHEKWVAEKLDKEDVKPIRVKRIKENIPTALIRVYSGKQLVTYCDGAGALSPDSDPPKTKEEMELISEFFQELQDWDLLDTEAGNRVRGEFTFDELLKRIENVGFYVFAAREVQVLEGSIESSRPQPFTTLVVRVLRSDNPLIKKFGPLKDDPENLRKLLKSVRPDTTFENK
jgi:hypothetical protein